MTQTDRFGHSPANPTTTQEVSGSFLNAALENETIDVTVLADGVPYQTIPVTLDGEGFGTFAFVVPGGTATMTLQATTSSDHAIVVG